MSLMYYKYHFSHFWSFDFICMIFWHMKFYFYEVKYSCLTPYDFGVACHMEVSTIPKL